MGAALSCSHCQLPVGRLGRQRDIHGEAHAFCCYGCCLAFQVHHGSHEEPEAAAWLIRLGVGAFLAMNIMLFSLLLYSGALRGEEAWLRGPVHWLLWLLATPLLLLLGGPFFQGAWAALRQGRLAADTLVALGAMAAYGYSAWQVLHGGELVYFDTTSMVLLLFTLGRYLEAQGRARAARSLAPMLAAERAEVRRVREGVPAPCPVSEVQAGDLVCVLPGERIAVDGFVLEGRSDCDESVLTGQATPKPKATGSFVFAGSVNGTGRLLVRTTVAGTCTRWVLIGRTVREALAARSLAGDTVDRVAAAFIPGVLLLAAATAWFWGQRTGAEAALLTGLAVLVVACPCSLGLAAPLASALAIGAAAQRGVLIRSGCVLERLAGLKGVAFDKTGTLTHSLLQVVAVRAQGASEAEVRRHAGLLAGGSEHPIARAIGAIAHHDASGSAHDIVALPGEGVRGRVGGQPAALGSAAFMAGLGWPLPAGLQVTPPLEAGCTLAFVGWAGQVHGRFALGNRLLPEAASVVATLKRRGLATRLLSGDSASAVAQVAATLGIDRWHADLLPQHKLRLLREAMAHDGPTAMVGDGLNDGPVLAAATVGIAVGGATDLARESADVVLPHAGVAQLPWLLDEARRVRRSVRMNLSWAFGYNAVALTLAASGQLQPVLAAALMAGSSLLVALRSWRAQRQATLPGAGEAAPGLPAVVA